MLDLVNYYPHHIGDYLRDTVHLSPLEDGIYRRMLDIYYASERPLPLNLDSLYRLVRAKARPERAAVDTVLEEFFDRGDDGWHNSRADREIADWQSKCTKAKASAEHRWKSERNATAMRTHSEGNANQNQNQNQRKEGRATRLPQSWIPSELLHAWALKERPDLDLTTVLAKFRDYWTAKPGKAGTKLDWDATFRNWVRDEKPSRHPAPATAIKVDA